jgi:hypothetical protein
MEEPGGGESTNAEIISRQDQLWSGARRQAFSGNGESQEFERQRMLIPEDFCLPRRIRRITCVFSIVALRPAPRNLLAQFEPSCILGVTYATAIHDASSR